MDKEIARRKIANLVAKYNKVVEQNRVKKYNEEMTKIGFIQPLFRALGWNIEDSNEVTAEEKISKKRVDYGFRIDGIPKFFLEAKPLKADLDDERYFEQAVSYAWHKGCTWAVLTDFEAVKILNAEWKAANYLQSHYATINSREFLKKFDELWLLSRESFEKGLLDKEAERRSKKTKKTSIDRQLLTDFTRFRGMLSKSITKLNQSEDLTEEELDESVQRILDRLIFIRNCEDRELEARTLISSLREWKSKGRGRLDESLRQVFSYFDREYDSKIFTEHLCDRLKIEDDVLHEVVMGLYYTKEKYFSISYDFSAIDADVLGNIYEQYLSHILKKTDKRAKLAENHAHRKVQGIYYTPTYIVDYIVKNTLGKLLNDRKTNAERVRVLDPACGSGSFLIKAFDVLDEYHLRNDRNYAQSKLDLETGIPFTKKVRILRNNIFGVDLDKQAVEITQLNLLLKIAEKGHRLPLLEQNIRCGNSLIADEKLAGDKALRWEEQFKEITEEGGFDVVIGNPPYVRQEELGEIKPYLEANYETYQGTADLYVYFFEKELKMLKENGYFGMIVSNKWLKAGYGKNLRKFISRFWIEEFIDFGDLGVFADATTYPCILILRKIKKQNPKVRACNVKSLNFTSLNNYIEENGFPADQSKLDDNGWNFQNISILKILQKIRSNCISLEEYSKGGIYRGIVTGLTKVFVIGKETRDRLVREDKKSLEIIKPFLTGKEVRRYRIDFQEKYIIFTRRGIDISQYPSIQKYLEQFKKELSPKKNKEQKVGRKPGNYKWYEIQDTIDYHENFQRPKLIYGKLAIAPRFAIDDKGYFANSANFFIPTDDKQLLAILNSKLGWFIIKNTCTQIRGGYQLMWEYFKNIPITKKKSSELVKLSEQMISLNNTLTEIGNKKTDKRARVENEIRKVDRQIDELVYEIYQINEAEKRIIEASP